MFGWPCQPRGRKISRRPRAASTVESARAAGRPPRGSRDAPARPRGIGHAKQRLQLVGAQVVEQPRLPAQTGRGDAQRTQRVADVVLAVAERAVAVLPGLAPEDRGQPDENGFFRQAVAPVQHNPLAQRLPNVWGEPRPHLQAVLSRGIMCDDRRVAQPGERAADQITLGWVQVAAGGIDAQRPAVATGHLPGRERQGVEEELRDACDIQGGDGRQARNEASLIEEAIVWRGPR